MQDRPTAPELLDAMAAQLFGEVREWVPRERRFQILVLANLCAVIAREIRAGDTPDRADRETFAGLTRNEGETSALAADLAAKLRSGALDEELPEAIEALRGHVKRKLDIARPGYAAPE